MAIQDQQTVDQSDNHQYHKDKPSKDMDANNPSDKNQFRKDKNVNAYGELDSRRDENFAGSTSKRKSVKPKEDQIRWEKDRSDKESALNQRISPEKSLHENCHQRRTTSELKVYPTDNVDGEYLKPTNDQNRKSEGNRGQTRSNFQLEQLSSLSFYPQFRDFAHAYLHWMQQQGQKV